MPVHCFLVKCKLLGTEQCACFVEWYAKVYCIFELEAAQVLSQQIKRMCLTNMDINSLLLATIVFQCIVRIVFLISEEYFVSMTTTSTNKANDGE